MIVILRVFVSSWWIGLDRYHEDAKTQRIAKFFGCGAGATYSELPHTAESVTGETPVPRYLRRMAVPAMRNLTDL
ncbi:MAG: hypothetical protein DMG10_10405 [Acidobacteria bacterium]|nr:MAG: hypothetical protein DMG10_10405 [Acidobacteriota bacterium]